MRVQEIDTDDDQALESLRAVFNAAAQHDMPTEPEVSLDEVREIAKGFRSSDSVVVLAGDDDVAGGGIVIMPKKDNRESAEFIVFVHPDHRRKGAGSAIVRYLERIAAERGRRSFSGQSGEMLGAASSARPFAEKLGYVAVLEESQWTLDLPVATALLDELEQASAGFAEGYEIVRWMDHCPEELIDGMADLQAGMSTDAPHGDLTHEAQIWDADRVRQLEDMALGMSNTSYLAGAVDKSSGRLVAFTVAVVNRSTAESGRQFATIVNRDHRGHRLGILIKVANLRQIIERSPLTTKIQTWNADTNTHMMSVNAALGFYASGKSTVWQKELPTPDSSAAV
ncbi:MAG TPA: GNAT family N-acetyltransferase [Acidimicrobiales bacterium]|nr:GNAT family N-acetyltransferase [Acidimicrobiales bacterium]